MQEKVFIKNKKGLKLAAVLHYPDKNKKYPAVILFHGFTGYKEEKHIEELVKDLEKNGFVALRFDTSGFGESEGKTEKDFKISNYIEDTESIYSYFRSLDFVDNHRIFIYGHSVGAMISIIFASKHKEIKGVCPTSPCTSLGESSWIQSLLPNWKKTGWFKKVSSRYGKIKIPYSFFVDSEKFNSLDYISRVEQPILFILGKKDDIVSPESTRKIFDKANEPKELIEVEEMDHDYKNHPNLIQKVNNEIISFFKKCL